MTSPPPPTPPSSHRKSPPGIGGVKVTRSYYRNSRL